MCVGMFQKVAPQENSRNSLLNGVAGFQFTGCDDTRNKLLIKFFKGVMKISEYLQEGFCNGVSFRKNACLPTTAFNLPCF